MEVSPLKYGLSTRIKLKQTDYNKIVIIKRVKSRIIQKDAFKIIEIADAIKKVESNMELALECNPNICSKSIALLETNGITVMQSE